MAGVSGAVTSEQSAARELVRDWAAGSGGIVAARDIEHGDPDAWRPVFAGLAELGLFGVAVAEDAGGAGGSIIDLCAMLEEAAAALVPGPVATTALATLLVTDAGVAGCADERPAHRRYRIGGRSAPGRTVFPAAPITCSAPPRAGCFCYLPGSSGCWWMLPPTA